MPKLPMNKERNWTPVKDGAELFDGILNIADGVGLDEALDTALDIGKDLFEALEHSSKVLKAATTFMQKRSDPAWARDAYVFLVRALKDTLRAELSRYPNKEFNRGEVSSLKRKLVKTQISAEDIHGLNIRDFYSNAFVERLLEATETLLTGFVLTEKHKGQAAVSIRANLRSTFEFLVTQPRYEERTKNLRWALKGNETSGDAVDLLHEFSEYQRQRFSELPLSQLDPFPLEKVFVEMNVPPGLPGWLSGSLQFIHYLRGPAGSGKSSLVKWVAKHLVDGGRVPITVLMRDVSPSGKDILRILDRAIGRRWEPLRGKKMLDTPAFEALASAPFQLNRVTLILDGLDELQIGTGATFQQSLVEFFKALQEWHDDHPCVNILITTRPGVDLNEIRWPWHRTPDMTDLKPFSLEGLTELFTKIKEAVPADTEHWRIPSDETVEQLLYLYGQHLERQENPPERAPTATDLVHQDFCELLSLPQLATLAYRELGFSKEPLIHFVHSPTDLYDQTINRAIQTASKLDWEEGQYSNSLLLRGEDLQTLLQLTALGITLSGQENISKAAWEKCIKKNDPELLMKLQRKGYTAVHDSLVASFYFRQEDEDGGCEFVHKSFCEFLFASLLVDWISEGLFGNENIFIARMEDVARNIRFWVSREVKQHIDVLLECSLNKYLETITDDGNVIQLWLDRLLDVSYLEGRRAWDQLDIRSRSYFQDLLMTLRSSISRLRLNRYWPVENRTDQIDRLLGLKSLHNVSVDKVRQLLEIDPRLKPSDTSGHWMDLVAAINSTRGRPGGGFPAGWDAGGLFPEEIGLTFVDAFWGTGDLSDAKMQGLGLMFNDARVAGSFWLLLKNATYFFGALGTSTSTLMLDNQFLECVFIGHTFLACRMQNATWYRCALQLASFRDCTISGEFKSCNLSNATFNRCGFYDINWVDCHHDTLEFRQCFAYGGEWPEVIAKEFDFSKPVSLHGMVKEGKWVNYDK